MKKKYISPSVRVQKIENTVILSASTSVKDDNGNSIGIGIKEGAADNNSPVLSKPIFSWDDDPDSGDY